jgi:type IV pilus assembly protein PilO
MALLPSDQRSQVMMLATVIALALGYGFWRYYYGPTSEQIAQTSTQIDSLQKIIDAAKRDLARGTVEDLRATVEHYRAMVGLMRRLVPSQNEVPTLIDDISTRAKVRGVTISKIEPVPVETGPPFDTYRYRLEILGHYDQVGEYLSDIASLPRVVVPQDVTLKPASTGAQRLLSDTAGALLQADFAIRTFVKSSAPPPPAGKKGAARAGGRLGAGQ